MIRRRNNNIRKCTVLRLDETVLYVVYFLKRMPRLDVSSIRALDTHPLELICSCTCIDGPFGKVNPIQD